MDSDRPATVQHLTLWAKRALTVLMLALILGGRVPAPTHHQPLPGVPLPPGTSGPMDGVGDSPVMPE